MPSLGLFLAFLATTAVFAFVPGPAMLYAAARTLAGGRTAGLMASLGIHLGGYVHVMAAASGLSVLFHAVPTLYAAVKLAGAAYLVWLGLAMLLAKAQPRPALPVVAKKSGRRALAESIAVEILNPKTAIFFLAFLPQFIEPSGGAPVWAQFLVLGTIVNVMFSSADLVCVLLAGAIMAHLRQSGRGRRLMQRAAGSVLVGLGAHLVLQRN